MNHYSIKTLITCIALLLTSLSINAEEQKRIVLGLVIFPPLVLQETPNGACSGPGVELAESVFASQGFLVDTYCAPAARLYSLIKEGYVDVTINVNSTSAIRDYVDFHHIPFAQLKVALLTNPSLESEKTISAIRGFEYHGVRQKLLENNFTFVDLPNGNDAVHVFLRSRTSGLLTYMRPYRYLVARSNYPIPDNIRLEEMLEIDTYFGVRKNARWHDEIFTALDTYATQHNIVRFSGVETLP